MSKSENPAYHLRDIDRGLWDRFKARAGSEGRGLRFVVLRLFELYAQAGLDALEKAAKR